MRERFLAPGGEGFPQLLTQGTRGPSQGQGRCGKEEEDGDGMGS